MRVLLFLFLLCCGWAFAFDPGAVLSPVQGAAPLIIGIVVVLVLVSIVGAVGWVVFRVLNR